MDVEMQFDTDAFMESMTKARENPVKIPGEDEMNVHKFMGDARDPFPRPQDHILCMAQKETITRGTTAVTLLNEDVTCPECLELIHA